MCGRTPGIQGRGRGIASLTVGTSHHIPGVGVPSVWPSSNSSWLLSQSHVYGGGVLSWTLRLDQLHTPGMGSAVGFSPGTIIPPPWTSTPWPLPTSSPVMCRASMPLCMTWRRWMTGHTFWRGQPVRSSHAVASPSYMSRPCHCWNRRLPGTAQLSLPARHCENTQDSDLQLVS